MATRTRRLVDAPPTAKESEGLVHVSVGLQSLLASPYMSEDAKDAIRAGIDIHRAHPHCPCIWCHRAFGGL
jgi:hypothetical protein